MQDGKVEITENDITTNLPYVAAAHLVIDHHLSETLRNSSADNYVIDPKAPSARGWCSTTSAASRRFPISATR